MNSGECSVKDNIRHALQTLFEPGDVVELRVPNTRQATICGYFDDFDALAEQAAELDRTAETIGVEGIYVTLNPVDTALLARYKNRIEYRAKRTTSDPDILRRRWLLTDFDPRRPAGISSTEAGHAAALQHAEDAARWLSDTQGWPQPILADSGNGGHLLFRIDLPNDDASKRLIEGVLAALDFRFSSQDISIDTKVGNAARIIKLYGTVARKGDNTPERPHRTSKLLHTPSTFGIVSVEQLKAVAAILPTPEALIPPKSRTFDLRSWLHDHNVPVGAEQPWSDGSKWVFPECPFNPEHKRTACIVMFRNGAIAASCRHNSCAQYKWQDFRKHYEPNAYAHPNGEVHTPGQFAVGIQATPEEDARLLTWDELDALPPENHEWLVEELLIASGTSLIVAKPKVGKSVTAQNLAYAVAHGTPFLGRKTTQGVAILIALEDKQSRIKENFRKMGVTSGGNLLFWIGRTPKDAIAWLQRKLTEHNPSLIIIDPLQRLLRLRDTNDYAQVSNATDPLIALARESGAHVACLHHAGKSDSYMGSTAFFGTVDTMLHMRRIPKNQMRTIHSEQRYGNDLDEVVIALDEATGLISVVGGRDEVERKAAQEKVLDLLAKRAQLERGKQWVERSEIAERVEIRNEILTAALADLTDRQIIQRLGRGKRGKPYLFALPGVEPPPPTGDKVIPFPVQQPGSNNIVDSIPSIPQESSPRNAPEGPNPDGITQNSIPMFSDFLQSQGTDSDASPGPGTTCKDAGHDSGPAADGNVNGVPEALENPCEQELDVNSPTFVADALAMSVEDDPPF